MPPRPDLGPKPLLGYTANHLARVAERRGDADFLAAREADPRAGAVAIGGELIVLKRSVNPGFAGIENELFARPNTMMVLGDAKKTLRELTAGLRG